MHFQKYDNKQSELEKELQKLRNDKTNLENEVARLNALLEKKDEAIHNKEKNMEAEIQQRIQSVAEYYQKKEQKLLKNVHMYQISSTKHSTIKEEPSTLCIANKASNLIVAQASAFLLAVELERMRSLYKERENENNEMIVNLEEYHGVTSE